MIYRVIVQEADGSLGYSSAYASEEAALTGAKAWSRDGLEVLRIERADGEAVLVEEVRHASFKGMCEA